MISPEMEARLDWDFDYHKPDAEKAEKHAAIRECLKSAAKHVATFTPAGREQSLAITKLEEAMFWANAALAREKPKV